LPEGYAWLSENDLKIPPALMAELVKNGDMRNAVGEMMSTIQQNLAVTNAKLRDIWHRVLAPLKENDPSNWFVIIEKGIIRRGSPFMMPTAAPISPEAAVQVAMDALTQKAGEIRTKMMQEAARMEEEAKAAVEAEKAPVEEAPPASEEAPAADPDKQG
jgi:hypothetical protein